MNHPPDDHLVDRAMRDHRPAEPDPAFLDALERRLIAKAHGNQGVQARRRLRPWMAAASALAACAALAVVLLWPSGTVSFAAVQRELGRVRTVQVEMRLEARRGAMPPMQVASSRSWFDSEAGLRTDVRLFGVTMVQSYVPWRGQAILVNHLDRSVGLLEVDPPSRASLVRLDPTALLDELRDVSDGRVEDLGERSIMGLLTRGFAVAGPALGMPERSWVELWVDPRTRLPVRLVCSYGDGARADVSLIAEGFVWDQPIAPDVLEPVAPEAYKQYELRKIPSPDEAALLASLRRFADATGGQYPGGMASWQIAADLVSVLQAHAQRGGDGATMPLTDAQRELMRGLFDGTRFYLHLVRRGHEPSYYGDRVTQAQPDAVLMRWRLKDGRERVIYGNLEQATLPPNE